MRKALTTIIFSFFFHSFASCFHVFYSLLVKTKSLLDISAPLSFLEARGGKLFL